MMVLLKRVVLVCTLLAFSFIATAQVKKSTTREFMNEATFTQINKDWTTIAEFNSGIAESVMFYPVEIINLKTNVKVVALQVDMHIKNPSVSKSAYVGLDEIEEFIKFVKINVIPNLDKKFKDKSSEYIFKAKEITLSFLIKENVKRITITLNSYDDDEIPNYNFWTETQVAKIPKLLDVLLLIK